MVAVLLVAILKVTIELEDVDVTVAYHQRCLLYNRLSLQTVVNLVTGLVEVEIRMLDGHVCLV